MFSVTITLTTAGLDSGPFNIYSDVSAPPYSSALNDFPISRDDMLAGFTLSNVPDGTTNLKVKSLGTCINEIIIPVETPAVCGQFTFVGGASVGNVVTYRDCTTGDILTATLNNGQAQVACAYMNSPYYPAFTTGSGDISQKGDCNTNKQVCQQYTLFAIPEGSGATFRYMECGETITSEITLTEGNALTICSSPLYTPVVASGDGNINYLELSCTTTTTSTSTSTTTSTTTTTLP